MLERPELSQVDPAVRSYVEALEAEVARLRGASTDSAESSPTWSEPPTTLQVITFSLTGRAKRTPRHLYSRQKRGGMGVFDLETTVEDPPRWLAFADEKETLLLLTNQGRAFRLPVETIPERPGRGRGELVLPPLLPEEVVVAGVPADRGAYLTLLSERGWVRQIHRQYLNERMLPGMRFHKMSEGGYIVAAAWTSGANDLLIITQEGAGIRFAERLIPTSGCLGIRLSATDKAAAVVGVTEESAVAVLGADGKGSVRLMAGFRDNKAPGAGGKAVFTTERVVGAAVVLPGDDIFVISRLSKMIRFAADEIPAKAGVVQGVQCMSLRADEVVALRVTPAATGVAGS